MKVFVIFSIVVLISIVILSTSSNVQSIPADRIIIKDSAGNQITPVLNKEVFFHYNVQNYGDQSQTYNLNISVNNDDTNLPIFHKKLQLILEPNESKPVVWSFIPTTHGNYSAKITKNEITIGTSFSISDYSKSNKTIFPLHGNQKYQIMSPLKQFQLEIPFDEIQCKQNLVLVQKYDGSPACVTESTKTKLIERGWTGKHSNAYTNIEVLLGEPKQDKLLPIIIREHTRKANDFDSITSWDFAFVKNTAETQTEYRKFLPQDERISYNVIGGDFTSIVDKTRKHSFDIPATSYLTEVDCESAGLKEVVTAVPVTFPITSDNYHVIVEHKRYGIYPDENDVYSFKMASFFNINDNFPDTALMLSEEKYSCDWIEKPSSDLIDHEYPTEPTYVEWKFKLYEKQNPE